jgi:hypothetical protein
MALTLLDPTGEHSPVVRTLTKRSTSLEGCTVALLDITKPRGNIFLDEVESLLHARGIATKRYSKPTFTKPVLECNAVIEALAD